MVDLFEDRGDSPLSKSILTSCQISCSFTQWKSLQGRLKHKLFFKVEDNVFERVAHVGGIAILERGLNEPSQTKKYRRSNGQSQLNFVNECPKY